MLSLTKYHGQMEADDASIFDPTALEIEAALRHERRKKQREQGARKWRDNETIIGPEEIDFFLLENEHSEAAQTSSVNESHHDEESKCTNDAIREKETAKELSARTRCRRKAIRSEETMLKPDNEYLENTRASETVCTKASRKSQASKIYPTLDSKGPFKLPVASSTTAYRYGGRRAGVCEAIDETSVARTRRRVIQKRFPDAEDWLLE